MIDALALLEQAQAEVGNSRMWIDQRFEPVKVATNTGVGDIGQLFIEKLCSACGFQTEFPLKADGTRKKQSPWDIAISGVKFELKTATLGVKNTFQFNHVRYHRQYDALLCLGITPNDAFFELWSAADVKTNKAGTLVSMERGANASFKLTKRTSTLNPIRDFQKELLAFLLTAA